MWKTHRDNRTKYRMGKHIGIAEQSAEWANADVQQHKVQNGKTHRYSRPKYRMGKHRGTAELKDRMRKHTDIASQIQDGKAHRHCKLNTGWESREVQQNKLQNGPANNTEMGKYTDTAEQSTGCENTQKQRTKYRKGKHAGTANQSTE